MMVVTFVIAPPMRQCLALLLAEWAHIVGDIAGPSLQLGGSIGATLSQGKLSLFERLAPYGLKTFRTDNEKRNFVSAGVSAGNTLPYQPLLLHHQSSSSSTLLLVSRAIVVMLC